MTNSVPVYLSESTLRRCLSDEDVHDVVCSTLVRLGCGRAVNGPKGGFSVPRGRGQLHMGTVSGCVPDDEVAGVKWFVTSDLGTGPGLARVPATLVVCDATTGLLKGIIDATELTSSRTAAMAVAASIKASTRPSKTAAVIGAGRVGQALLRFLVAVPRIDDVRIASRNAAGAEGALARTARPATSGARLRAMSSIEDAVRDADLVFTATSVADDRSLVLARWLKPGAVVCALGSHREVEPSVIHTAGDIVVDDPAAVQMRGNLAGEFRAGRLSEAQLTGTVGALMAGQWTQRVDTAGPVLLAFVGLGVLDVALGDRALRNAARAGLGVPLSDGPAPPSPLS